MVQAGTEIAPAGRLCAEFEINGIDAFVAYIRIDELVDIGFAVAGFRVDRDRRQRKEQQCR
jgi:hypothetical protein